MRNKKGLWERFHESQLSSTSIGTVRFTNDVQIFQNQTSSQLSQPRKPSLDTPNAAIKIQRAFRRYRSSKDNLESVRATEKNTESCTTEKKANNRPRVLSLFNSKRNKTDSQTTSTASSQTEAKVLGEVSLFQKNRETILVFGGRDPHKTYGVGKNTAKDIFRYLPDTNAWEFVGELPEPRHHHCTEFFKGRIWLIGGADPRNDDKDPEKPSIVQTVWSFDPVTRKWLNEKPLYEARKNFGLVACHQTLYAIGGQGQNFEVLNSVECFNINVSRWQKVASMKEARTGLSCGRFKTYILVAGGLSEVNKKIVVLDSVEKYDTRCDQWTKIKYPLRVPRCFSSMSVLTDKIYMIGGAGKTYENEKLNTSISSVDLWVEEKSEWRPVTELSLPRHGHALAYLGTQIFVIGGVTTIYGRALNDIECFCSERDTWVRGITNLPTALSGHSAITLPPAYLLFP